MKANQFTIQLIERSVRRVVQKFPSEAEPRFTDIYVNVCAENGEMRTYDDDGKELDRCIVEQWVNYTASDFYDVLASVLRKCLQNLRPEIEKMAVMRPFSFILVDDDQSVITDLMIVDDQDTMILDGTLLEGLEEDLDAFLENLLAD